MTYVFFDNCLNNPFEELKQSFSSQLVATITHQSHLCPLPLTVQPIIWNYDHCLRLYPTPHTVSQLNVVCANLASKNIFEL